jgi:hypothetical protein
MADIAEMWSKDALRYFGDMADVWSQLTPQQRDRISLKHFLIKVDERYRRNKIVRLHWKLYDKDNGISIDKNK